MVTVQAAPGVGDPGVEGTVLALVPAVADLAAGQTVLTQLAVAEERLRFSHDVHDVLGRRLSAIAVLSELAATLTGQGDPGGAALMMDVQVLAHEAMDEARELARGYRPTDLARELEGARSLLRSAGIAVALDVEAVPHAWQEAAAGVVRESVTNVLRHSTARQVCISFVDHELWVVNDGAGTDHRSTAHPSSGAGLSGLRERLERARGATLVAGRSDQTWRVALLLPGWGPTPPPGTTGPCVAAR